MASELYNVIDALSREKGIDPQIVVSAVEDAIVVATRKYYKTQENLRAVLDRESGHIRAYAVKQIVGTPEEVLDPNGQITLDDARKFNAEAEAGGELLIEKPTDVLGRIAAQLAKQVIFQKVREAERDTVYNEYIGRVAEIVNATVKRIEGQDLIFDVGKAEARMSKKEQSRLESFAPGERVRVVIVRVEKASKGPQVVVSRAAPELVTHLFQTEVPEIYDGTVVIRAIAREAGERTKIAVMSKDKDVDAVGACVGMKGMRVQSIIRELRGEKIDIIEYHEDPVTFAEKALQPAKVSRVSVVDSQSKHLEVIVDDSQLSLAIGKKGQNVRLAAKLLGWKIDIKSEEEKRQEVEQQMSALVGTPSHSAGQPGGGTWRRLAGEAAKWRVLPPSKSWRICILSSWKQFRASAPRPWKKSSIRSIITFPVLKPPEGSATTDVEAAPLDQPEAGVERGPDRAGFGRIRAETSRACECPGAGGAGAVGDRGLAGRERAECWKRVSSTVGWKTRLTDGRRVHGRGSNTLSLTKRSRAKRVMRLPRSSGLRNWSRCKA